MAVSSTVPTICFPATVGAQEGAAAVHLQTFLLLVISMVISWSFYGDVYDFDGDLFGDFVGFYMFLWVFIGIYGDWIAI